MEEKKSNTNTWSNTNTCGDCINNVEYFGGEEPCKECAVHSNYFGKPNAQKHCPSYFPVMDDYPDIGFNSLNYY